MNLKSILDMENTIKKIVEVLEKITDCKVDTYTENDKVCGFEINTYTNGGVNNILFIDMREYENFDIKDVKTELIELVKSFDIDTTIMHNRQNENYINHFSLRKSLEDFENYKIWLDYLPTLFEKELINNNEVKSYRIPITYQSLIYMDVEATNLQEATKKALNDFFSIPDENYLCDSFEVDAEYIKENYPHEKLDYRKLLS